MSSAKLAKIEFAHSQSLGTKRYPPRFAAPGFVSATKGAGRYGLLLVVVQAKLRGADAVELLKGFASDLQHPGNHMPHELARQVKQALAKVSAADSTWLLAITWYFGDSSNSRLTLHPPSRKPP